MRIIHLIEDSTSLNRGISWYFMSKSVIYKCPKQFAEAQAAWQGSSSERWSVTFTRLKSSGSWLFHWFPHRVFLHKCLLSNEMKTYGRRHTQFGTLSVELAPTSTLVRVGLLRALTITIAQIAWRSVVRLWGRQSRRNLSLTTSDNNLA